VISARIIASGSVRRGLRTSSPAVETASRPMKVKKIVEAAAPIPAIPKGTNGSRLSPEKPENPMTTNRTRTATLRLP
jgi:hypothetical protein